MNSIKFRWLLTLGLCGILFAGIGACLFRPVTAAQIQLPQVEELTLPSVFSDHMVLQQNKPIKVWGVTVPSRSVTVTLEKDGQTIAEKSTSADKDGFFEAELPTQKASFEEYTLKFDDGTTAKTIEDVLVGEVWLASGQSNMALDLQYSVGGEESIRQAADGSNGIDNTKLRMFMIPLEPVANADVSYYPQFTIPGATWALGNDVNSLNSVSGVAYHFALETFRRLNAESPTPVAIINSALGSTSIHAYMSRESIENTSAVKSYLQKIGLYKDLQNWNKDNSGGWNFNQPSALFNHKIAPIAGYGIQGILWYQGENNVGDEEAAAYYKTALSTMLHDWSVNYWGEDKNIPMIFAHPAPYEYDYYSESLAYFWEALDECCRENSDSMVQVPIYDIPLTWKNDNFAYQSPIHPLEKKQVGERMAQAAAGFVYGDEKEFRSPVLDSFRVEGSSAILTFKNVGEGLKIRGEGNEIKGFAVCGGDRQFVSATAEIIANDTIKVSSPQIEAPVAVTYAFAGMNMSANVVNSENLPLVPFRTDKTASVYYQPKDWMYCDDVNFWLSPSANSSDTGFYRVWEIAPAGAAQPESQLKSENGAIVFAYGQKGTYSFGINNLSTRTGHLYNPIFGQWGSFDALQFNIQSDSEVTLSLRITDNNGNVYRTIFKDSEMSDTITIGNTQRTYRAYLKNLKDTDGNYLFGSSAVENIATLEFCIESKSAGSVSLDSLELILSDPLQASGGYFVDDFIYDCNARISENGEIITLSGTEGQEEEVRNVLALPKDGSAGEAVYAADGMILFEFNILSRNGMLAYMKDGVLLRGYDESISASEYVMTYTGDNGMNYAYSMGRWWRYRSGDKKYQALTGEYPIFPTEELPACHANIRVMISEDGKNWEETGFVLETIERSDSNGYIRENYNANLKSGTKFVKISFDYESREEVNGNTGMIAERTSAAALERVSAYDFKNINDTEAPTIEFQMLKQAKKGDTVFVSFSANDAQTYWKDLKISVTVHDESNREISLNNNAFVAEAGTYTVSVTAEDLAGNSVTKSWNVTVLPEDTTISEESGCNSGIAAGTFLLAVILIGFAAKLCHKKRKGAKV